MIKRSMLPRVPARNFGHKFLRRFAEFKRRQCQSVRDKKFYLASLSTTPISAPPSVNLKYNSKNIFCVEVAYMLSGKLFGFLTASFYFFKHTGLSILVFFVILHHFPFASAQMVEENAHGNHLAASILVATAATAAVAGVIHAASAAVGEGGGGSVINAAAAAAAAEPDPDYTSGTFVG